MNSDRKQTLESLLCIRIPACQETHAITSEWVGDLPIIVSHSFASLMLFVHLHTV
jgi:hypothetical protein